jgi:hypothetical protein
MSIYREDAMIASDVDGFIRIVDERANERANDSSNDKENEVTDLTCYETYSDDMNVDMNIDINYDRSFIRIKDQDDEKMYDMVMFRKCYEAGINPCGYVIRLIIIRSVTHMEPVYIWFRSAESLLTWVDTVYSNCCPIVKKVHESHEDGRTLSVYPGKQDGSKVCIEILRFKFRDENTLKELYEG